MFDLLGKAVLVASSNDPIETLAEFGRHAQKVSPSRASSGGAADSRQFDGRLHSWCSADAAIRTNGVCFCIIPWSCYYDYIIPAPEVML